MTDSPRDPRSNDLPEVATRNRIAQHLATAIADTPALSAEITRLRAQLADARLDRANLAAAALATIAAYYEGEADPLAYLRDELRAQGFEPSRDRS